MFAQVVSTSLDQTRPLLVSRIAKRSFCHVQDVSLESNATSSDFGSMSQCNPVPHEEHPRVRVARFPSTNGSCCHYLFVEHGDQLKRVDLASTRRVDVRQRFYAEAGDQLSFDCVVLLKSGECFGHDATARAMVVNLKTQAVEMVLDRTVDSGRNFERRRIGSNARESQSVPITVAGEYELQTITSIDPACPGAEAHLLIDSVRVTDGRGTEKQRLASLSCVGRVAR